MDIAIFDDTTQDTSEQQSATDQEISATRVLVVELNVGGDNQAEELQQMPRYGPIIEPSNSVARPNALRQSNQNLDHETER